MANFDDLLNNAPAEESGAPQLSKEEYAEKKKAEREELFGLSDDVAMQTANDSEVFRQYLDVQGRFDRYSAVNALLILAQQENLPSGAASRLGDYEHWNGKGGIVKSKSVISILEPHEYTKDDNTPGTGYNVKKVFDISQVDTRKMKLTPPPNYGERQLLSALVKSAPVAIVGVENLSEDMGAMRHDERIDVRKGMGFADTFRSLTRELALVDIEQREIPAENAEFTAYCASYLLCKKYGADTKDFSFDEAPGAFDGLDAQGIKGELSQIRDAAENISGRMARQLEAQQKAAKNNDAR
ncbi:hypothetical protein FACS18947_6860 [Bacteroidia bacterium]|nr:hypothetical protein FACS18947_6860 [Bacteroidia bacterium]